MWQPFQKLLFSNGKTKIILGSIPKTHSVFTERLSYGAEARDFFGFFRGQIRFPDYFTLFIG